MSFIKVAVFKAVQFFLNASYASLFVIELEEILVNDKIRAASQSNNFVTQALYQKLKTSK